METNFSELFFVILYFIGMIVVGVVITKRVKGSEDYLAAGRNLPGWLVTATLFATWWGGGTVLGGSGAAFHDGFHGVIYDPYGAGLTLLLAGLFFMKIVHDAKVNTAAQFFSCRYGTWAAKWAGIMMVPTYCLWAAVQLVAIGKIFEFVLGWPYAVAILIGAAIVIFYTVLGGMLAVAWTDFFQVIILLVGLIVIFPLSVKFAGGWDAVVAATPAHFFKIFPAEGSAMATPDLGGWLWWLGALLGVGLGTLAAPDLYQRAIIAKTGKTAATASLVSGAGYWILGAIPVYLAFVAITLIANGTLSPELSELVTEDSEKLILVLIRLVLHPALAGIFIASLLAAVMSSADSAIFAPAAILSNDLYKPLHKNIKGEALSDKGLTNATRITVVIVASTALLIGFFYDNMYDLLIVAFQMLFHVLFFPLVLGVYWKKANAPGAVSAMITGFVLSVGWMFIEGSMFTEPEWLWALGPGTVGGIVMVIVSLATEKSHAPLPLTSTDGEILKFAELAK
ncbi:MAG: sodium/solute symporter [Desulfobacterales bacterium]|nr:sodium/solute symporter [Desulfobacterales bacterium]